MPLARFALPTLLCCLATTGLAAQTQYQYTIFDDPNSVVTHPYAIDDAGNIVGSYEYGYHGFQRDAAGQHSTIDFPGASHNLLRGSNDQGMIVGEYRLAGFRYSFTWVNGVFTTLPKPNGIDPSGAHGVNNLGVVVGSYMSTSASDHGYIYDNGVFTTLDFPGATSTILTDIDDQGVILGSYWLNGWHGFTYDGVSFTTYDMPGAHWTYLAGFNSHGQMVGQKTDVSGSVRTAILYDAGTWVDLAVPGSPVWTAAQDINEHGAITGFLYEAGYSVEHGFLAEPQPRLQLSYTGTCPGAVVFEISDATSLDQVALGYSIGAGSFTIPAGYPCAGTDLGLSASTASLVALIPTDATGTATLAANLPSWACGTVMVQAVDLSTCETSAVLALQ